MGAHGWGKEQVLLTGLSCQIAEAARRASTATPVSLVLRWDVMLPTEMLCSHPTAPGAACCPAKLYQGCSQGQ